MVAPGLTMHSLLSAVQWSSYARASRSLIKAVGHLLRVHEPVLPCNTESARRHHSFGLDG